MVHSGGKSFTVALKTNCTSCLVNGVGTDIVLIGISTQPHAFVRASEKIVLNSALIESTERVNLYANTCSMGNKYKELNICVQFQGPFYIMQILIL